VKKLTETVGEFSFCWLPILMLALVSVAIILMPSLSGVLTYMMDASRPIFMFLCLSPDGF
jgi:hypothetical protein